MNLPKYHFQLPLRVYCKDFSKNITSRTIYSYPRPYTKFHHDLTSSSKPPKWHYRSSVIRTLHGTTSYNLLQNISYAAIRTFKSGITNYQGHGIDDTILEFEESTNSPNENASNSSISSNDLSSNNTTNTKSQNTKKKKKKKNRDNKFLWPQWNRPIVHIDLETEKALLQGKLRCKKTNLKVVDPPQDITKTIDRILKGDVGAELYGSIGDQFNHYLEAGHKFKRYIESRKPFMEENVQQINRDKIEDKVRRDIESKVTQEELKHLYGELQLETQIQKQTDKLFKQKSQTIAAQSKHIAYDLSASWAYLLGKAAYDYATMYAIYSEIKNRTSPDSRFSNKSDHLSSFAPKTLLDFGSGVGTSLWAANEIFGEMSESFSIDSSKDITDLNTTLLLKGHTRHSLPSGHTFRLHLPRNDNLVYDLVTCSHTLLDISTTLERINVIDNLWRKTCPSGGFLVLVENGSNAGFQVIQEARHYLLQISNQVESVTNCTLSSDHNVVEPEDNSSCYDDETNVNSTDKAKDENLAGHLFSPCPHTNKCPRYEFDSIPCNYDIRYRNFHLQKIDKTIRDTVYESRYSYVVFRKGGKTKDCEWPRVVEPVQDREGHSVCRLCTPRGTLEEILVKNPNKDREKDTLRSKKLESRYYRSLHCGDQLKGHLECGFENYDDFVRWATLRERKITSP